MKVKIDLIVYLSVDLTNDLVEEMVIGTSSNTEITKHTDKQYRKYGGRKG